MPTARELLEQADALMRRNRASVNDDIPVLTDAVPSAQEVQGRYAPAPRPVPLAASVAVVDDDVPVLTDDVEEIEAAALDPEIGEGEPSVWLDYADASVIGDAPDSIAMVPPVDMRRPEPVPDVSEFDGLDEELAAAIAAAPREDETLQPAPAAKSEPAVWHAVEVTLDPAPVTATAIMAGGAAALLHDSAVTPPAIKAPANLTPVAEVTPPTPEPPTEVAPIVPISSPAAPPMDDAVQWEAMAEEIRMQVLQRIDLFTDTGLRTQLGERLQPIVDRASADLVATINQHVGELLRAYVAEAIEREIDCWRRNH